ncbi:MAG: pyridoxal 5'-phosphate synthase glutaminase subunit PdxT [bacterium]
MSRPILVGILAFQGDFAKHQEAFKRLGCEVRLVKSVAALEGLDCLVMPGGESSTIYRFLRAEQFEQPLIQFAQEHPVWGSCAGMILVGREIANDDFVRPLGLIDMTTSRNTYGRQYESFIATGRFVPDTDAEELEMVFIRAPKVEQVGEDVRVLGKCGDEITIVQQDKVVATSFHPELTDSTRFQEYFLSLID